MISIDIKSCTKYVINWCSDSNTTLKKLTIACSQSPRNFFNVTPVQVTLSFVIVVDGIDNVFLAVLDDLPDGTSDHVTRGNWGNAQAFALAFE